MSITSIRFTDDVDELLEESRWQDTLEALYSLKMGNSIDEEDVNAWLNTWGAGT